MVETSLETLKSLWEDCHSRLLAQSADYRTLMAIGAALRSMQAEPSSTEGASLPALRGTALDLAVRTTQAEAARRALEARGEPMPLDELIQLVPAFGGRKGTPASLSSSLSQAPQFVSIRYANRWCWWLSDRQLDRRSDVAAVSQDKAAPRSNRWRHMARVPRRREKS